jgi:hypothetical protein
MNSVPGSDIEGEQIASELVAAENIAGDDEQDTILLRKMSEEAKQYISSFSWCDTILDAYFGGGVGGIFAIFFFHIRPTRPEVDAWIWVVVGDIPPAYLPVADCQSPAEVFRTYIRGMNKWVELARLGQTGTADEGVPPVNVPVTPEWAEKLNQRLHGLTLAVKPFFEDASNIVN